MLVKANGIQINYELTGKKDGPVVVLSHSLGCSFAMWDPQMEILEPHFKVLRYDVRGHGKSDAPNGPYTPELLGEDVVGLLDALQIDRVHFVGLSMGGMIGQCLAVTHAERLHSVTLCDTFSIFPKEAEPAFRERIEIARNKGMEPLVEPTLERWFTPSFIKSNPPILGMIRRQLLATPVEGFIGCVQAILRLNYRDRLSRIDLPTLILVGEEDPGTPVSAAQAIQERIKDSKLVIIPSAQHLPNVERPADFNRALSDFLRAQIA